MKQEQLPPEDDASEVAPGVVRVQLPILLPGLGHVNCYVLEDDRGVTLVDPGLPGPEAHAELMRRINRAGYPPERVHTVLVTHSHPDHFGGAGRLEVELGCDVVAHRQFVTPFDRGEGDPRALIDDADLDRLEDVGEDADQEPISLREMLFGTDQLQELPPRTTPWGGDGYRPSVEELEIMRSWDDMSKEGLLSLRPTRRVDDDQEVELGRTGWQVVHTPGHTGDHICLFDPDNGTLISGDHVLPTITPHISGMMHSTAPGDGSDALAQFFAGLRRVAAIDGVTTVLPAHGLPFSNLAKRTEEIIEHHEDRLDTLRSIAQELGEAEVPTFSQRLFRERSWGPLAESETYAHLEHLRADGDVTARRDSDGMLRYRPAA